MQRRPIGLSRGRMSRIVDEEDYNTSNREMVMRLQSLGILKNPLIVEAFLHVPRHMFVPEEMRSEAYVDEPLPITNESTISQPSTVAIVLEALDLKPGNKVLDIGTGSGWQACLLAYCVGPGGRVVTVEIDKETFKVGKRNIEKSGFKNVKAIFGDGSEGYSKEAPYDRIEYTAATPNIPNGVLAQLKVGGKLLAPVNKTSISQRLIKVEKTSYEEIKETDLGEFLFLPLRGKGGYQ